MILTTLYNLVRRNAKKYKKFQVVNYAVLFSYIFLINSILGQRIVQDMEFRNKKVGQKMAKKKMLLTLSVVALGIASYALLKPVIAETTIGKTNENQTISIYKNLLKGKSEKEINDYFSGLSDSKLIIADKSGGFTTSSTDDYSNPVETIDENGNKELKYFQDKSVAATVGEIKEALKNN